MKLKLGSRALAVMMVALGSAAIADPSSDKAGAMREHAAPPPGSEHTTYDIVVNKLGRKIRGTQGTTAFSNSPGEYIAQFPADVTNCVYVATLGRATTDGGTYETAGFISAQLSSKGVVSVETRGLGNHARNRAFHLLVAC